MRRKARLVVCGNYERNMDLNTYAATSRAQSLRAFCVKAALHKLRISSYDVQGAYLSADVERDVFVLPPPLSNCPEGFVYKLQGDVWLGGLGQGVTEEGSTCVL